VSADGVVSLLVRVASGGQGIDELLAAALDDIQGTHHPSERLVVLGGQVRIAEGVAGVSGSASESATDGPDALHGIRERLGGIHKAPEIVDDDRLWRVP
jgi:hypothetical protein